MLYFYLYEDQSGAKKWEQDCISLVFMLMLLSAGSKRDALSSLFAQQNISVKKPELLLAGHIVIQSSILK